jgi:hypothetical protein
MFLRFRTLVCSGEAKHIWANCNRASRDIGLIWNVQAIATQAAIASSVSVRSGSIHVRAI